MNLKKSFALALLASCTLLSVAQAKTVEMPKNAVGPAEIAVLLPGFSQDNGFMNAGYRGYQRIATKITPNVKCVSDVSATSDRKVLTDELRLLAQEGPKFIIAHGGQCNGPVSVISKEFPNIQFVVIQGNVKSENVASYRVNQVQSAYLAGALAGYMTKTGKVGHISGAWPQPGLNARAAFYDGLKSVRPDAKFYTHFTGNLDSNEINAKAAEGEIAQGVDVIYTMLNGGRFGVNDVIAKTKGKVVEIGNVIDWTKESKIFIGSAVADSSEAISGAAMDYKNGAFTPNSISTIGLEDKSIVRLAMSKKVPKKVRIAIEKLTEDVLSGKVTINTKYDGLEFNPTTGEFENQAAKEARKNKK
ncbi:MAG: BMP family protein [Phascolarctobacterium sp.]|nr:BMP family protein [Phascolarctobacterium sp.]